MTKNLIASRQEGIQRMVEEADSSHYELLAKSCELTGVPT